MLVCVLVVCIVCPSSCRESLNSIAGVLYVCSSTDEHWDGQNSSWDLMQLYEICLGIPFLGWLRELSGYSVLCPSVGS